MSLDWLLNDIISKLDRGFLLEQPTRQQMVNYFNTIIEKSKRASSSDGREECKQIVTAVLKFHQNSKHGNEDVCLLGKYHDILYVAAKLCYLWRLKEASTVCELLLHIYQCENTLEKFFECSILGVKIPRLISGWRSDYESREENIRATLYFLRQAAGNGLTFEHRNFLDVPMRCYGNVSPLKAAVKAEKWDLVTLLIRFGAITYVPFADEHYEKYAIFPLFLRKLESYYAFDPPSPDHRCGRGLPSFSAASVLSAAESFRMYWKTTPNLFLVWSTKRQSDYDRLMSALQFIEGILRVENLKGPYTLKHLARCACRMQLAREQRLPVTADTIAIPKSVCDYLNLDS